MDAVTAHQHHIPGLEQIPPTFHRIAATAGLPLEQVLSDALFKLAGELSLQALECTETAEQV